VGPVSPWRDPVVWALIVLLAGMLAWHLVTR
jgi:hypothetical protein